MVDYDVIIRRSRNVPVVSEDMDIVYDCGEILQLRVADDDDLILRRSRGLLEDLP